MTTFAQRRWRNSIITIVVAGILIALHRGLDIALYESSVVSGWALIFIVLALIVFRIRKDISTVPLLSNAVWMQFHAYAGILSIVLFAYHIDWRIPNGYLELVLGALFLIVAGSGLVGLGLARVLPRRLARRGEEVIWERIPIFVAELRGAAEDVIRESASQTQSTTIRDFYLTRLHALFVKPRNLFLHLIASDRPSATIRREFRTLNRYLNAQEREYADKLRELVEKKNDLDFHYALQLALKAWLLAHVPLTYSLLILAIIHLFLVYAFSGGL